MSFNAKNLAYESKEPSFLRKLKSQYGGTSRGLERPAPRPRKLKDQGADDDDGPTYVDAESNEVISKEDYEAMVRGGEPTEDGGDKHSEAIRQTDAPPPLASEDKDDTEGVRTETGLLSQNVAEIGALRKRKQGKVVGDEEHAESDLGPTQAVAASTLRKSKTKKKKIKLSFDEA